MKRIKKRNIGREILEGLREIRDTLAHGVPLEERFDVRHVEIPEPSVYGASDVRRTRERLRVSQPVFARLMGISSILEKAWEQGRREPSPMARRLLDEINHDPDRWTSMFRRVNAVNSRRTARQ
jgi:putative transcriptional regulator